MAKKLIKLTESDLHRIVEDVVSDMTNGINQQQVQPQQPQQQAQQQMSAFQKSLVNCLNNMQKYNAQQFTEINKKLEYMMYGGTSRYSKNGGFVGFNNM